MSELNLEEWLRKLDHAVDPEHVNTARDLQRRALDYGPVDRLPAMVHFPAPEWPRFTYKEAFYDREKMLLNELGQVWVGALGRDDRMYMIRSNHGVGILASLFGCEVLLNEDDQMPWVEPLNEKQLDEALSRGVPDLSSGLGGRVVDTERFYLDTLSRYDNLAQTIRVFCCDIQGPFDCAHLVMGHRIYTDVLDNPELVHRVLDLVTDTFIAFARAQREVIGEMDGFCYHSQHHLRGAVRVCDDSPTNLSAGMYREFCKPYNERIFKELGGGWIHYCGEAKQMLPEVLSVKGLTAINFGNPEKQDAPAMFEATAHARVPVISWQLDVPDCVKTGVTLTRFAATMEEAREITGFGNGC